jgi:hypothetical protein
LRCGVILLGRTVAQFVEVATVHVARARPAVRRPRACPFSCPPGLAAAARAWEARALRSMSTTTDVIRGLPDDPDLSVEITTGTEHFRNGAIALTVRGDGAVSVQQRRSGGEREYRGRLDAERMRRLADELAADELGELADSGGDREPDDLPITIRIERAGELLHAASIRDSDRWKDERLNRVVRRYDALVAELTDGALPYGRPA